MRPLLLHYYVTNRCNSRCGFCSIWGQQPKLDVRLEQQAHLGLRRLGVGSHELDLQRVDDDAAAGAEVLDHE